MKPYGMDMAFRVITPTQTEDKIWEAVREAINEGWTPERFKHEAADAWKHALRQDAEHAVKELTRR